MANPWFRLYAEFAYDPKVQIVTEALQRRYVMLLCLQCNDQYENRPDDEIALALRVTIEIWQETKKEFINRGLLDIEGNITAWEKRQYISDLKDPTAAERQKRYRESKKVTRNVTVTSRLPEQNRTDTDTDTDTDIKPICAIIHDDSFERFWSSYPKKVGKDKAIIAWKKKKPPIEKVLLSLAWQVKSQQWLKENKSYIPNPSTYINEGRWKDERPTDDFIDFVEARTLGVIVNAN